ncbi:MAG: prepilin-type N-terminal cleavage/methylation domain-containing protein [Deltaproteobacteria bacterium]|nr:prepilin-type N-terminal cleavage/methylation domain-containing protein [Deltaproteobacteria bacterium]
MNQLIKRIITKSPFIPLFQRGSFLFPPFGKGRLGGILQGNFQTVTLLRLNKHTWLEPRICKLSGFTLIEVVVSLTILGFILLIIFGAFRLGLSSWDRGELIKEEYQNIRIVSDLMTKQVKSVVPYKVRTKKAEGDYLAFEGKAQSVKFISTVSGKVHTTDGLVYTVYQFKEGKSNEGRLILYEQRVLNRDFFEEEPKEEEGIPLIEGVSKVLFEYYQEEDATKEQTEAWLEEWNAKEKKELPKCLRVALSLKKPDGSDSSFTLVLPISAFQYEEVTRPPVMRRRIQEGVK